MPVPAVGRPARSGGGASAAVGPSVVLAARSGKGPEATARGARRAVVPPMVLAAGWGEGTRPKEALPEAPAAGRAEGARPAVGAQRLRTRPSTRWSLLPVPSARWPGWPGARYTGDGGSQSSSSPHAERAGDGRVGESCGAGTGAGDGVEGGEARGGAELGGGAALGGEAGSGDRSR